MNEFKFACPMCGQHIQAVPEASGSHIECPTCFAKLVVPEPRGGGSKLVLKATRVEDIERRKGTSFEPGARRRRRFAVPVASILFFLALGAASYGAYVLYQRSRAPEPPPVAQAPVPKLPGGITWNLNPTNGVIPSFPVKGRLKGQKFRLERAVLHGGTLSLRQGEDWPPNLGANIILYARKPEHLAEKTILIWPDREPPVPKVVIRWKDAGGQDRTQDVRQGYALKLVFGKLENERLTGQIFLSLPEEEMGVIAGRFEAEVRRPPRPGSTPPDTGHRGGSWEFDER